MEDLTPRISRLRAWHWSLLFVATVAGGLFVLSLLHREKPLVPEDLPLQVLSQLRWKHGDAPGWKTVTWESQRTIQSQGQSVEVIVHYRLENLGNGLGRRTDAWYSRHPGTAIVYEERYLTYANLVSLESRYREPAPAFHAIMADTGWVANRLQSASIAEEGAEPSRGDWKLNARIDWLRDPDPLDSQPARVRVTRDTQCKPVIQATSQKRPRVSCELRQSDGLTRSTSFVYVKEVGLFFILSFSEQSNDYGAVDAATNIRGMKIDGIPLDL